LSSDSSIFFNLASLCNLFAIFSLLCKIFTYWAEYLINKVLVELEEYSGPMLKIYSVFIDDAQETLFDQFLEENKDLYPDETSDLVNKIETIGNDTGLNGKWFKRGEGSFGDGICCLFDYPDKNLRLYFIRFGNAEKDLAIVFGGGYKPKEAHALQEVQKLKNENYLLRDIAAVLHQAIQDEELGVDKEGFYRDPDFIFQMPKK